MDHLIYFVFGAAGTAGRLALSTTLEFGLNKRTIVEVATGGVGAFVLVYFGDKLAPFFGLDAAAFSGAPVIIKGGIVFLLAGATSLVSGEIIARIKGPKP